MVKAILAKKEKHRNGVCLTNNFYLGKLKSKEIDALMQQFQSTFTKKTEKHYLITLCKSCYERTELAKIKKSFIEQQPFEIVG